MPEAPFDNPFTSIQVSELADPNFNQPSRIDALLGIDIWSSIVNERIIRQSLPNQTLLAQLTQLGWVISGQSGKCNLMQAKHCCMTVDNDQLYDYLQRFWATEAIPSRKILSADEKLAEDIFVSTHSRDEFGRYVVRIPWKPHAAKLGNSKNLAMACFRSVERKLAVNMKLYNFYRSVFDDHRSQGHFIAASEAPPDISKSYVIPHHPINTAPNATGKPRIVYNASAKSSSGVSLNDCQLSGYKLQEDLYNIFLRGRMKRIGISSDIIQMFRQVHVHKEDWNYQRIIWRDSPNMPISEYFITCIAWGTTSASWNAVRALRQCAIDEQEQFPKAANTTLNDFYYDDLWTGVETDDEAIEMYHQLNGLLSRGGFSLAKWVTNSKALANIIKQGADAAVVIPDETEILGMIWTPTTDELRFKVQPLNSTIYTTKREVVSKIAQIYDPSGVIAPVVIVGKIIIQDLWRTGINWDDTMPDDIASKWDSFCSSINSLDQLSIPRWIGASTGDCLELHVFADASEKAYGAVAYIRVVHGNGSITANIISAKSRVAPLKKMTIPRLELLAALMAAKLASYVIEACHMAY